MQALNPLYQGNMGQKTGLSFGDIKAINMAYCADKCSPSSLARPCEHGGYQDPNNCHRCICPDGFGGPYCDQLARPTNGKFFLSSLVEVGLNAAQLTSGASRYCLRLVMGVSVIKPCRNDWMIFTSAKDVYVMPDVCLSVCLVATLRKNY